MLSFPISGCREEFFLYDNKLLIANCIAVNLLCKNTVKNLLLKITIQIGILAQVSEFSYLYSRAHLGLIRAHPHFRVLRPDRIHMVLWMYYFNNNSTDVHTEQYNPGIRVTASI